jgi:putative membrane protein
MSRTLIICVDRDNDFGEKAGVRSPVIGRDANLKAANELILKDPEDSDSNALFSAIATYDHLRNSGEDVEICTLCGDKNVGLVSDRVISDQLEEVLRKVKCDQAIVVSDGAEDEFIIPIIESRIKIRAIKRITVRQAQQIESLYYIIVKALKEEKFMKKVLVPIGVAFLVLGLTILFVLSLRVYLYGLGTLDPATTGFMTVVSAIGIYFLGKAYSAGKRISETFSSIADQFINTRITVFSLLISAAVFAYGVYSGLVAAVSTHVVVVAIILLLYHLIPLTVASIIIFDVGRILESLIIFEPGRRSGMIKSYLLSASFYVSFFVALLGLLSFVNFGYQRGFLKFLYLDVAVIMTISGIVVGTVVSVVRRRYGRLSERQGEELRAAEKDSRSL